MKETDWEHKILSLVLQVSLSPEKEFYLKELCSELITEGLPLELNVSLLDRIFYARLSDERNLSKQQPTLFDYLLGVWKRSLEHQTAMASLPKSPEMNSLVSIRTKKLEQVSTFACRYCVTIVHPDLLDTFPQNHSYGTGYIGVKLVQDPESIPKEFFIQFLKEVEDLPVLVSCIIKSIMAEMRERHIYDNYLVVLNAFKYLQSFPDFVEALLDAKEWTPNFCTPRTIEVMSVLGQLLSKPTVFPDSDPSLLTHYFGSSDPFGLSLKDPYGFNIGARNWGDIKTSQTSLREASAFAQKQFQEIFLSLIKFSPKAKESVLHFIAFACKLNADRGKLQVDRKIVSTDGFLHNLLGVCLLLAEPLADQNFSKLPLIDVNYFHSNPRLDMSEETHIFGDQVAYNEFVKQNTCAQPNFVTEIFFLTICMCHYSFISSARHYGNLLKELQEFQKHIDQTEAQSAAWANLDPRIKEANHQVLKKMKLQLDVMIGTKLCMETGLTDPLYLDRMMRFYSLVMMWLIKVATGSIQPSQVIIGNCPQAFPCNASEAFKMLPEWIIDDICEFFLFIGRHCPTFYENQPRQEFIAFAMFLLMNPGIVKNPYLKSKLVEILFFFTMPLYRTQSGEPMGMLDAVLSYPLAKKYLIDSILNFYVDVEQTGTHSQFYDKFNIRYNISQILKHIWNDPSHQQNLIRLTNNKEFFIRFAALLMNDTTYLMDEGLSKLKEIATIQIELPQMDEATKKEKLGILSQLERHAMSYISLGNETVYLLSLITSHPKLVDAFLAPEVVDRFAAMLNYNLVALCGPRCTELKVKQPEKYRFNPKKLLNELVDVYLNLSNRKEFIVAIARDGRSYNKSIFSRAGGILTKFYLKTPDQIDDLNRMVEKVEEFLASEKQEEEELGDIPDEFLDPVLFTLMEDPVRLPSSGVVVDRSTIKTHLLSDAHDPFNRQPLTLDQVIPETELLEKILLWKSAKKK